MVVFEAGCGKPRMHSISEVLSMNFKDRNQLRAQISAGGAGIR
jgi:hypothetical protein